MSAEKPTNIEREQIDAMSPEQKKMSKNRVSSLRGLEYDIVEPFRFNLTQMEFDIGKIEDSLDYKLEEIDKKGSLSKSAVVGRGMHEVPPRVIENIKEGKRIVTEIKEKLDELNVLFKP